MYEPVLTDEKLDLYNVYEVHKNYRILAMAVNVPLQVAEEICHILKCASRNGGYSYSLLCLLIGRAFIKKKPFYPKYGEMVYYVTVSGYIQEVRFDTDSTLHQLLRKAGKLYRSEEEAKRYLDKDYKDLIIQEEE